MRPGIPLGLAGIAAHLPAAVETADAAVADGRIDPATAADLGYAAVTVSEDLAAPEMAALAGRAALAAAGTDPAELSLVLHSWMYHQGHDVWSPPHYLARELGAVNAHPVGVQQVCNGSAAALSFAVAWLDSGRPGPVLLTSADRFGAPEFERWTADYSLAYGDSATAAVVAPLDPRHRVELLSVALADAPELELMHRGDRPFGRAPLATGGKVDVRGAKKQYLAAHGKEIFTKVNRERLREVLATAMSEAGAGRGEVSWVALPRLGSTILREVYEPLVTELCAAPVRVTGRRTGHLGPGDVFATVAELADDLAPGRVGLVLNAGAGFSFSCIALRGRGGAA
ncbi:3-oxoacyl-ACP synthase [Saccharothrix sp. S26]|uniref:3-oxoacyl-ACP synthase n=1 Tax=Saccharothrix sp. S26 TaxID=2907215 RepID=UPI001F25AED1|nr:3-oxoacyl-ACP synthase [Saccharothrix sp. S26]MCE6996346.1 3-oxoacyl-ACP synthase [Saccharothrix sp. S26]